MLTKFFIDQHGCAKNQVDGELLIAHLTEKGYSQTFNADEADLIIINSCGFIESAKVESINAVQAVREWYPKAKILLAGCLAERYAEDLKDSLEEADGFFGNGDLSQVYKVIEPLMKGERPVLVPEQKGVCGGNRNMLLNFSGSTFVKITEGCNNRCSFCAIPVIRGELRSRPAEEILCEIKELVSKGIYEINLVGQDLAAYGTGRTDNVFGTGRTFLPKGTPGDLSVEGGDNSINGDDSADNGAQESGLCTLIKKISQIKGTFICRLLYIHPDHFNEDILPVMKADSRFLPYFDIPFQSGDDQTILKMHRVGSQAKYKQLIEKIRSYFPDAAIRTTFLAGFPGETEEAAQATREFLQDIKTEWSGCFPYSKEDDTPAYDFKPQVPKKTAQKRADLLVEIQAQITREKLALRCGKDYDILIEEVLAASEDNPDEGMAIGRAWFQAPEVDGSVVVRFDASNPEEAKCFESGRIVKVYITASGDVDLTGDFVSDSQLNETIAKTSLKFAQNEQ